MFSWKNSKMLRRVRGQPLWWPLRGGSARSTKKTRCQQANSSACENIRFSWLFAALDVSCGGTSATQLQKFHTDDAHQCLHNKSGSHAVPNINLSNFSCLLLPPRERSPAAKSGGKRMFSQATNSWRMEEPERWDRTSACKGALLQPIQFMFWSHLAHPDRWRHMSDRTWHRGLRGHYGPKCYLFQ